MQADTSGVLSEAEVNGFLGLLGEFGPEATGEWLFIIIPAIFLFFKELVSFVRWKRSNEPPAPASTDVALLQDHIAILQKRITKASRRRRAWSLVSVVMAGAVIVAGVVFGDTVGDTLTTVLDEVEALEGELQDVRPVDVAMTGTHYDVAFVRGASGDYDQPADPAFPDSIRSIVEALRGDGRDGTPVLFLKSHASSDGDRSYNVSIASSRANIVASTLRASDFAIGDVTNGFLRENAINDKVVRVEVGFLES